MATKEDLQAKPSAVLAARCGRIAKDSSVDSAMRGEALSLETQWALLQKPSNSDLTRPFAFGVVDCNTPLVPLNTRDTYDTRETQRHSRYQHNQRYGLPKFPLQEPFNWALPAGNPLP